MARQAKTMAVLFADICDSTSLYQKLGDAAARNVVNACLSVVTGVLPRYDGRAVKTIGDEVMCVFPSTDLAVLAASEMQSLVSSNQPGDYPVMIHVGLHYGSVLVEKDDVFGDAVNVAAYLTAVATPEQILTTETTEKCLSAALKSCVRPVFRAMLKGSTSESTVYQVLWRIDNLHLTDVNLHSKKLIPGDTGSLLLTFDEQRLRMDMWRPAVSVGRAPDCDLVVTNKFASRKHLTVKLMRTNFYLIDHSINGTFVCLESGEEIHVLRSELLLDGVGQIILGRSRIEQPAEIIRFSRDRRSMYRI
ncbi:MAG TPA: adenylate/guanylate cyclase domain-containing protein [Burkholderiales bacterium]|nr:adenylate/guanylate cyclase domain-containing protein [Burkholderiales bacterium]